VAWGPLGWKAVAFSEIEPFPSAVLAHHYPDVPNYGDMTKYQEWPSHAIDLLCGGTPCQSFSVAGLRKGLDDPRGNLMLTFGAIAAKYRPRWLVWENVPGVLSSNGGRDFGSFLGLLGHLGYGFAYRVLDAQYFGVAQRRRRVFVVGCLGDWRSAAAVLFERHSLSGHPAPSREAGQGTSRGVEIGPGGGRFTDLNPTLDTRAKDGPIRNQLAGAVLQHTTHTLRGEGFDASEDGTGRGTPLVPVAFQPGNLKRGCGSEPNTEVFPTLAASHGRGASDQDPHVMVPVPFDTTQITSAANYSNPKPGDPCHAPAIAFPANLSGTQHASTENLAPAMGAKNPTAVAFTTKLHNTQSNQAGKVYEEYSTSLDRSSPPPALLTAMQVRRLTPTECERLQGFPDGYTAIPWRGKPADQCPDGPRYKALGNSWAVPCATYIGERIDSVNQILSERKTA